MREITIDGNNGFEYTYSAKRQREIESIKKKYLPKEEDKLETLKRLDRDAEKPGLIASLATGMAGSLIFGTGLCCAMMCKGGIFVLGIIIGLLGMGIMGVAYPIYKSLTKKRREKIAEQIIKLSEELSV